MKNIVSVFHGGVGRNLIRFSLAKLNIKQFNLMDKENKKYAIEFLEECKSKIMELQKDIHNLPNKN